MKDLTVDASMITFDSSQAEPDFTFIFIPTGLDKGRYFVGGDVPAFGDSVDIVCVKNDDGGLALQFKTRRDPS